MVAVRAAIVLQSVPLSSVYMHQKTFLVLPEKIFRNRFHNTIKLFKQSVHKG